MARHGRIKPGNPAEFAPGKARARDRDWGGVYYALADGSKIVEVAHPILTPNGIGLSPDGRVLYVAETETARLWAFDIVSPGVVKKGRELTEAAANSGLAQAAWKWRAFAKTNSVAFPSSPGPNSWFTGPPPPVAAWA